MSKKKILGLKKINNKIERYLSPSEELALAGALGDWFPYLVFSVLTGMRQGNQFGLRWEDVDWERQFVMLPTTKTGIRLPVLLSRMALDILRKQRERFPDSEWCFPSENGQRTNRDNFNKRIWVKAKKAAGIVGRLRWHDLRHTAASRMIQQGVDLYTVGEVLGQSDYRTTQRYSHLSDLVRREAMEKLASVSERQETVV